MIKFWDFKNNVLDGSTDLYLYGEICSDEPWHTDDYVGYRQFIQELKEVTSDTIHLHINSPGGEVMAANAIFNQLKECGKKVIAHIDGMCASAATLPLMAADHIIAACNAMILIHDPLVGLMGYYNTSDLTDIMEYCDKMKSTIIATYRSRISDITEEEFSQLMTEERWLDANEAQEIGLVDEVAYSSFTDVTDKGKYLVVNSVKIKKEYFKNIPANCQNGISIHRHMQSVNEKKSDKGGYEHMDETENNEIKTLDELRQRYPELCKAFEKEVRDKERMRLKDIDDISASVPKELLDEAKYGEKPMDASELALQALLAEKKLGESYLNDMRNDAMNSKAGEVTASPESGDPENETGRPADKGKDENKVKNLADELNKDKRRK